MTTVAVASSRGGNPSYGVYGPCVESSGSRKWRIPPHRPQGRTDPASQPISECSMRLLKAGFLTSLLILTALLTTSGTAQAQAAADEVQGSLDALSAWLATSD